MEQLPAESRKNISEEELLELAKKELLRDVKCASVRAEQFGAHSWAKPQKYVPNKRFLRHMLVNASRDNYRKEEKLRLSKSSRVTSHHSRKRDSPSKKDKAPKKKKSRWDSSPEQSKLTSSHKSSDKEIRSHSHPAKVKKKKSR